MRALNVADVVLHALLNRANQSVSILIRTLHDQLNSPVVEVPDVAGDVELPGHRVSGVTKTNALDSAGE